MGNLPKCKPSVIRVVAIGPSIIYLAHQWLRDNLIKVLLVFLPGPAEPNSVDDW
jgi:hypothetical protein